jgi:hypothetical protein
MVFILLLAWINTGAAADSACFVCSKIFGRTEGIFSSTDSVTGEKVFICGQCVKTPDCHICGIPSGSKGIALPDGRHLCPRDAQSVVLDPKEITKICDRIKDETDREFIRFMSFPTNIQTVVIDRLDVQSMYVLDGHDVECPDILGWCRPITNDLQKSYLAGLMSGLPLAQLQSTFIHEITHAWVSHNLSPNRQQELARSTEEGFCELMAFLMMKKHGEEKQQKVILKNLYTRGQIHLFIEAERRYGLNDVLDWVKHGEATNLTPGHLDEIHKLKPAAITPIKTPEITSSLDPNKTNAPRKSPPTQPAKPSKTVRLDGIVWSKNPVAIINGRSFRLNESGRIPVGTEKILIRCLAITNNSTQILLTDVGKEMLLHLPED